jgi:hypothetical protein
METAIDIERRIEVVELSIMSYKISLIHENDSKELLKKNKDLEVIKKLKINLKKQEKNLQELQDEHPEYFI